MPNKIYADKGRIEFGQGIETAEPKQIEGPKLPTREEREQGLREATLENIGTPDDLIKVDIKQLWDVNHYRVNIYREIKGRSRLVDSYYVWMTADEMMSAPPMEKKYHDADLAAFSSACR